MSKQHRLSSASATCRLEWRPSKLIVAWLVLLAVLSPGSLLSSALPRWLAWPLAFAAALWALRIDYGTRLRLRVERGDDGQLWGELLELCQP